MEQLCLEVGITQLANEPVEDVGLEAEHHVALEVFRCCHIQQETRREARA